MTGSAGRMQGRADHILDEPGGVIIEDYKSGLIYEPSADDAASPLVLKEDYRAQLLLYAALFHDETGTWPRAGRIVPLVGEPVTVPVQPEAALDEVNQALTLLDRYNDLVARKGVTALSTPSAEACASCSFRGMCPAYWEQAEQSWQPRERPSAAGRVESIGDVRDGSWYMVLDVQSGTIDRGSTRIIGLTTDQVTTPAGRIEPRWEARALPLRQSDAGTASQLRAGPETEIWVVIERETEAPRGGSAGNVGG